MRNAYAVLGFAFIIVFGTAFVLYERAHAPTVSDFENGNLEDNSEIMTFTLTSPAFDEGKKIPSLYTCEGDNINPPLTIEGVPEGTESLVLVMDDPDIPQEIKEARGLEKFNHWVVYNLPKDTKTIEEGDVTLSMGENTAGQSAYTGPCPPSEYQPTEHRYVFRLYAVSGILNFIKAPTLDEVEEAAKGMMLDKAELMGVYEKN